MTRYWNGYQFTEGRARPDLDAIVDAPHPGDGLVRDGSGLSITEDSCEFCKAPHAPLSVMAAMPTRNQHAEFIVYPCCESCYLANLEEPVRTARVVWDWSMVPADSRIKQRAKFWSTADYQRSWSDADEQLATGHA